MTRTNPARQSCTFRVVRKFHSQIVSRRAAFLRRANLSSCPKSSFARRAAANTRGNFSYGFLNLQHFVSHRNFPEILRWSFAKLKFARNLVRRTTLCHPPAVLKLTFQSPLFLIVSATANLPLGAWKNPLKINPEISIESDQAAIEATLIYCTHASRWMISRLILNRDDRKSFIVQYRGKLFFYRALER